MVKASATKNIIRDGHSQPDRFAFIRAGAGQAAEENQLGRDVLVCVQLDSLARQRGEDLREERARCRVDLA